jgi:hypothetical protein
MRLSATELGSLLRAHGYLTVERPPQLWDLETTALEPFVHVMGELQAAALARNGGNLATLALAVANLHVRADAADPVPAGDLVAITVRGPGTWPDARWSPGAGQFLNDYLAPACAAAGAVHAYARDLGAAGGSISVLFRRLG